MGPQALNLSTRGLVSVGDNVLIGGFIVTGPDPKTMVLRALGPSLSGFGLSGVLADPVLSVYNSSRTLIATNDNWQEDIPRRSIGKRARARQSIGISHSTELGTGRLHRDSHRKGLDPGDWLG